MKFELKDSEWGGYYLFDASHIRLIDIGDFFLFKKEWNDYSACLHSNSLFDYHDITHALSDSDCDDDGWIRLHLHRLIVIEMI